MVEGGIVLNSFSRTWAIQATAEAIQQRQRISKAEPMRVKLSANQLAPADMTRDLGGIIIDGTSKPTSGIAMPIPGTDVAAIIASVANARRQRKV
jgi:hypothetical protein